MSGAVNISISEQKPVVTGPTLKWVLKRTVIGLSILLLSVSAFACLLYASIEPDRAEAANPEVIAATPAAPPRTGQKSP
ncbi:MAG: hypothetical protein KDJ47_08805 [Hyphomicrobiaceae bacterium]|nr:hypothetical protein [Hyphomicrobiaceae bacterium]